MEFFFSLCAGPLLIKVHIFVHQEILAGTAAEAERWQGLYEELEQKSGQLRKNQNLKEDQVQQLQSQVEVTHSPRSTSG